MYLKYGNYRHADNEASVAISKEGLFTPGGIARGVRERWTIQGRLQAADQAGLTAAIDAITAAYSVQGQDVAFYRDDDQPTSHAILGSQTNGKVRVVVPPSFPEGRGAEYSTFRNYTIVLEAERLDPAVTLLHWNEVLSFHGGGPRFALLETLTGLPQKQVLRQFTAYHARQTGEAVGNLNYPAPASPLWPDAEHVERREIRYDLPRRMGPPGSPTYTQFKVSWSYTFEDAGPLVGLPTAWPS
jgi:hypothetical protein